MQSATISGTGMTDPDEFQRFLRGVNLNSRSGSHLIVINAVVVHQDSFAIPYPYEIPGTSMEKVPKALADVSTYGCDVWD